ncbi:MAG: Hpt domain-containing protein [Oligoflexia bacterium]|nr:Hpt domain-containing protein [Oligoflexia bacterium]
MVQNDDAEFLAEMRSDFLENLPTELEDCEGCLMRFEKSADPAELAEFKRLVHSMKGGGRMVALAEFSNFLHGLETRLQKFVQEGRLREFAGAGLPFLDLVRDYACALRDGDDVEVLAARINQTLERMG